MQPWPDGASILKALTQQDEAQLLRLIKELIAAQLVVEESADQFAFRHALSREAVYADLLVRERKALHRTIAETLERLYSSTLEAHLADLTSHFSEAGAWEKALEYGQRAGEQAQALYAPQAAIEHFTRALMPQIICLSPLLQACIVSVGWPTKPSENLSGRVPIMKPRFRWQSWLEIEMPNEALRCHQEVLATFQALNDPRGKASTLDLLGMASYLSGDLIQSSVYYQQAIALLRELDEREGLISSLVTLMHCCGNYQTETLVPATTSWAEALQHGELALKIAREIGQRSGEAYALRAIGQCLGPRGEYARALEVAQDGFLVAEEIGHRQWMAAGHWVLGALYLDLLILPTAQQHLEQAATLAQESGSLFWIHTTTGFLAIAYMAQHDLAQAESLLTTVLDPNTPSQTLGPDRLVCTCRACTRS